VPRKVGFIINGYVLDESPTLYFLSQGFTEAGYQVRIYHNAYRSDKKTYERIGVQIHSQSTNDKNIRIPEDVASKSPVSIYTYYQILIRTISKVWPNYKSALLSLFNMTPQYAQKFMVYSFLPYIDLDCIKAKYFAKYLLQKNIEKNDLLIVVEPEGLLAYYFSKLDVPFIYLSLELNNLSFEKNDIINIFKHFTAERYIKEAEFIIIQDEAREKILREDYNLSALQKVIHLPVSIKGNINRKRTNYFKKKFCIPDNKKIVLYAGSIMPWACILEIIKSMKKWDKKFVFVIHGGRFDDDYLKKIIDISLEPGRIFISTDWVAYEDLDQIISSAHIGVSSYIDDALNNSLTIKASGKIATYLKSGLPIVTRNIAGMEDFYRQTGCGECFDNFGQIGERLSIIDNEYERYRENAFKAFREHYAFDKYFNEVIDYITAKI